MSRQRLPLRKHLTWWTLCSMVLLSLMPVPLAAQVGTEPASSGQVIAQGIDTLPRGDLNWRVIDTDALAGDDAEFGQRSLGFAYASHDPFIVSSLTTGENALISEGQAHFSPDGSTERRSSQDSRASGYLSIELTTEEAAFAPGSDESSSLLFLGDAFRSPRADHNIQLTRAVALPAEEAAFAPENDLPYLLIVTEGVVQVTESRNDSVELGADTFTEFTGEIDILAGANQGATWLIASVGSEVEIPPIPTAESMPADKTGTLEIQLERCPDDFEATCEPTTSDDVTVPAFHHQADENWIIPDRAQVSDDETTYTYTDLPAGLYTTGPEEDAPDNVNLDGARWSNDHEGWDFRIREGRTTTLLLQVAPTAETGSFLVALYDCPVDTDPIADSSDCEATTEPWDLWIAPTDADSMDQFLTLFDTAEEQGNGQFLFENVPATSMDLSPDPDGPDGPTQIFVEGDPHASDIPGLWSVEIEPGNVAQATIYRILADESTGSLFVTLYDCPAGSDPAEDTSGCDLSSDPWDVAVSDIGQSDRDDWSLFNDAIDMGDGSWWFELLPATTLTLSPLGLNPTGGDVVFVSGDAEFVPEDTWRVEITDGGGANVSIYRVSPSDEPVPTEEPTVGTGSLVITQFDCAYGTDIDVDSSSCELSTAPWDVIITNLDSGESLLMMTDGVAYDSGTYVFESLPAGTYSVLTSGNGNWSISHPSTAEVTADDETYFTIYSVDLREP